MGAAAPVAPVLTEGLGQEWYQADMRISIRPEELECGYFLLFSKMTCHFSQVIKLLYFSLVMFFSELLKGLFFLRISVHGGNFKSNCKTTEWDPSQGEMIPNTFFMKLGQN